jgi:hypothetical protein
MSNSSMPLAAFAVLLSLTAITLTVWPSTARGESGTPSTAPPADAQAITDLRREVAALREMRSVPVTGGVPARIETPAAPVDLEGLTARVTRIEQRFDSLFKRAEERVNQAPPDPKAEALRKADVATLQTWFGDPARTEEERLEALRELRGRGPGARSGPAAQAAIQLVQTSTEPRTRTDVWRQMHGAKDPALVPALINSLQTDPDTSVREKAAETLDDYVDRPEVHSALRTASEKDADDKVRGTAARAMTGKSR